ncbi:MAG: aldehyde dehydrogenase family protein, partial [Pedobacter sp.]
MSTPLNLKEIFVEDSQIPEEFRLSQQINQTEYLSNGEMKTWTGQVNEVYSPICIKTPEGYKRKRIGSFPVCTEIESQQALEAAVAAYDNGRGHWPTMSVAERIGCVEQFTQKMIAEKEIVTKLIMWEIGKSYTDSIKEFDRTVEYIYATIDALKDIDRQSSRFEIQQGIVAQVRRSP